MKHLTICRHAKSGWTDPSQRDIDRSLNTLGYSNAHEMGAYLQQQNLIVDYLISSTALRAFETAKIFAHELGVSSTINLEPLIYEASVASLQSVIEKLPEDKTDVILFGHNPGLESLCNFIDSGSVVRLTTCNIAQFRLHIKHWKDFDLSCGKLLQLTTPKSIAGLS